MYRKLWAAAHGSLAAIDDKELVVASVLSGNRNFEGRINSEVRANYLMCRRSSSHSRLRAHRHRSAKDAIGTGRDGKPVFLADIWPTQREVEEAVEQSVTAEMFSKSYAKVFEGDERWRGLAVPKDETVRVGERFNLYPARAVFR